ncbi:MAG: accessory factor UbiK family protein [Pseudomonadota bacterium]
MTQTTGRVFDDLARFMTSAAGAAQGVREEVETIVRGQAEKFMADMDVVRRDEFEAVRAMAQKARAENEALAARIAALEARLGVERAEPDAGPGSEAPAT